MKLIVLLFLAYIAVGILISVALAAITGEPDKDLNLMVYAWPLFLIFVILYAPLTITEILINKICSKRRD